VAGRAIAGALIELGFRREHKIFVQTIRNGSKKIFAPRENDFGARAKKIFNGDTSLRIPTAVGHRF
jgi:hypothetical protein